MIYPTEELDNFYNEEINREKKLRSEFKKKLKGLINITGLFRKLDAETYWWPEDIVELELTDETIPGYRTYQHARIVGDESRRLYMKTPEDDIDGAKTPQKLFNAFQRRAKHMRESYPKLFKTT